MKLTILILVCGWSFFAHGFITPEPTKTPGVLCQPGDADFKDFEYPENIARCNRNISNAEKLQVAQDYGNIPASNWANYEFDHMIPLCAGGANDPKNLWPQPISEARQKDVLENNICLGMRAGTMKQAEAIQKVRDWFQARAQTSQAPSLAEVLIANSTKFICKTNDATIIRFALQSADTILDADVTLVTADRENEVIRAEGAILGKPVLAENNLLKNFLRFVLNKKSDDHFELFLPNQFSQEANFKGYFKVSFEGNYPNLTPITCQKL